MRFLAYMALIVMTLVAVPCIVIGFVCTSVYIGFTIGGGIADGTARACREVKESNPS